MNAIATRDPLSEFIEFSSSLGDSFDGFSMGMSETSGWIPDVDISENEKFFQISADLPNVKKEDVSVSVDNRYLTISGERHYESVEENSEKTYHLIERKRGSCLRRFPLPDHIDTDQIVAKFDNGILEVILPKKEDVEISAVKEIKVA